MSEREEVLKGLRECLDWLQVNPEVDICPQTFTGGVWGDDAKSRLAEHAKAMGHAEKDAIKEFFYLQKEFSGKVKYRVAAYRDQVCERVIVGRETIPACGEYTISAKPAHEVEIVEWRCGSVLADSGGMQ